MVSPRLSYCAGELRTHDRDRFLTVLFAPPAAREALFALYAFNLEVAKIRETVSEPMLGQVRLQWWREAIDEAYRGHLRSHEVVQALGPVITEYRLSRRHFERLIDARENDLDNRPPPTMAALEDYAEATSSALGWLALEVLGARSEAAEEAVGHVGVAWAFTGLLRALPLHLKVNQIFLPSDLMVRHRIDLTRLAAQSGPQSEAQNLGGAVAEIADVARTHLAAAGTLRSKVEPEAAPALLPSVMARAYLRRLAQTGHNPFFAKYSSRPALIPITLAVNALLRRY